MAFGDRIKKLDPASGKTRNDLNASINKSKEPASAAGTAKKEDEHAKATQTHELAYQRAMLLVKYEQNPFPALRDQINTLAQKIHELDPSFPITEPKMHLYNHFMKCAKELTLWLSINSGLVVLGTALICGGSLFYVGVKVEGYRRNLKDYTASAESARNVVNAYSKNAETLKEKVDKATANLDKSKELFISEVYRITSPLKDEIAELRKDIAENNKKIMSLEQELARYRLEQEDRNYTSETGILQLKEDVEYLKLKDESIQ